MTRPRLLIFDLDGTLIDSAGDIRSAANGMLEELGRAPLSLAEVTAMVGDGAPKLVERALAARPGSGPADPGAALARFLDHYEAAATDLTVAYPGVPETLAALAADGFTLVVCTNKPERTTRQVLDALGLTTRFSRIVGGDSLPWRKPDPRVLHAIMDPLGVGAAETLMVGDSEVDAATAAAASVAFVLMTYGYHRGPVEAIPAWRALDRFADLVEVLAPQP